MNPPLSIGQCATLACLLEVTSSKPGNVHRGVDFADMTFGDFVSSSVAIGPVMERAASQGIGATVLAAIVATRQVTNVNTNLGTVLLLAPLSAVPREQSLADGIEEVIDSLVPEDAKGVYAAIQLAQPGGLGEVDEMDVRAAPPEDLVTAMGAAAERDLVAKQYVTGFDIVLNFVVPALVESQQAGWPLTTAAVHAAVRLLAKYPDSLIARKRGQETAKRATTLAQRVVDAGQPETPEYLRELEELDFWLRSDHHHRNPGTTADLIAAGLFAGLRAGKFQPPFH